MDPVQGNPETSIENVMSGMTEKATPEAKPETVKAETAEGTKTEGKAESQKQDLPAWTSQLPEDIRSNADVMKQLTKFGKIGDLAKSYSELEGKIGRSLVQPGKDAGEEEINAFYQKLGRPETAEGYSITDKDAKAFKELAFKNNLTDTQAKSLYETFLNIGKQTVAQQQAAVQAKVKDTEAALKAEYGNSFSEKMRMLERGVQTYGGQALGNKLKASGLLYDADVVKMFVLLGEQASEAGSSTKGATGPKEYRTTAEGGSFTFKGL